MDAMGNYLKITPYLDIQFSDLMRVVDPLCEFTLRDILFIANNSTSIPVETMKSILHCNYIDEFYVEATSNHFKKENDIEYLEVFWDGSKDQFEDEPMNYNSSWLFHGVGFEGIVPDEDVNPIDPIIKATYRQKYAIEFSTLYNLSGYLIKINPTMTIVDWTKEKDSYKSLDFRPSITLIELMYAIFYELSFFGSVKERDEKRLEIERRADEVEKARINGTLDQIMIPWETVKERITATIEKVKQDKETKPKE